MTPLKVGMVSFAHSSHPERALAALMRNPAVQLVGISDHDQERARPHAARYGLPLFTEHRELMTRCDAIVVSSEYRDHHDLVVQAAELGVHVLCEKPLATTLPEMVSMLAAVERSGIRFMVDLPCRYLAPVRRARELVRSGTVGEVISINGTNRGACPGGWFVDPAISGGGAITDHSAHMADLFRWFTDAEFVSVHAFSSTRLLGLGVEDSGLLQVEMSNGVIGTIDTSWSRGASMPSTFDITMRITGTEGTISVDALRQRIEVYAGETEWSMYGGVMDEALVNDFVDAVLADAPLMPVTGEDGLEASLVSLVAYESLRLRRPVRVDELREHEHRTGGPRVAASR